VVGVTRTLFALKLRLFRNGPHDERGFGLVAGLALAALVVAGASAAARGAFHEGWIAAALTVWGGMWVLGPLAQPRHDPSVLSREWLRGYPIPSWRLARALSWTELLGVGPLITLACLLSLLVLAAPAGPAAVAIAGAAVLAQLYLLVWAGKTVAALAAWLLQTRAGMTLAAVQTAVMLALSFAGWVPVAAWLLPRLGDGDIALMALTPGQLPTSLIDMLMLLPTGWGYGAVVSARDGAGWDEVVMPLAVLLAVGALLQLGWIALTAHALRRPPRRATPKRPAAPGRGLPRPAVAPQVWAVADRELATWLRDPARGVELRSAWLTPLLMVPIIGAADWNWALPLVGPAAAVFGAMVAINTYALDGTALWQVLTTPGAVKSDVHGRMLAWALLFGAPSVALAAVLWALTASPVGGIAVSGAIVAAAVGCTVAPLLAVMMPAVGADARDRIYPGQQAGDPTGGQMTIFPLVLVGAAVPGVIGAVAEGRWWVTALSAILLVTGILATVPALVVHLLRRRGTRLLDAMASRDATALRPSARTEG
jgi:ABC-2 type transport system permease protein